MKIKLILVNLFGATGYLVVIFSWMWSIVVGFAGAKWIEDISSNRPVKASYEPYILPDFTIPEPAIMAIIGLVTITMIAITVYALIKTPIEMVKKSTQATHSAAVKLTPRFENNQPINKKRRSFLVAKSTLYIKILLVLLPVLAIIVLSENTTATLQLPQGLAILVSAAMGALAIVLFGLQYLVARIFRIETDKLI